MSRYFLYALFCLLLLTGQELIAESPEFKIPGHNLDLNDLQKNALDGVKRASEQGFCSPEIYEAGLALRDLIFYQTSYDYNHGMPKAVWSKNEGAQKYFRDLSMDYADMSNDRSALIDRLRLLDVRYPVTKMGDHGPSLETTSHYNAYDEALRITKGNVFRAATLIGSVGHDDIGNLFESSNLFAPNSIGIQLPADVVKKFGEAGRRCTEVYGGLTKECTGAGSSFNYHVNFGFFLGCYLAKKGFAKASVSKLVADGAAAAFNDPYLEKELAEQQKLGKLFSRQYQIDICSDFPKLLGYFYKKTTMAKWLTADARLLYDQGYRTPFLERDGKNTLAKPVDWSEDKWRKAIANLDYRLVHLEYGSKQAAAGAKRGGELCSEYAAQIKPAGLSPEAETIYKNGNTNPDLTTAELVRLPPELKKHPEKLNRAWQELSTQLRKARAQFDYDSQSKNTEEIDKQIEHVVGMLADRQVHTSLFGGTASSVLEPEFPRERLGKLDEPLKKMSSAELFDYLERKAARTELNFDTLPDAERHARLLAWAMNKFPELKSKSLEYFERGPSDFLKQVILSSEDLPQRKVFPVASKLITTAREPLLSSLFQIISRDGGRNPEVINQATSRIGDIAPDNLIEVAKAHLYSLSYRPDEKKIAIKQFSAQYKKLGESAQKRFLSILYEEGANEPAVVELALAQIKSSDSDRVKFALGTLYANPAAVPNFLEDLKRLETSPVQYQAEAAKNILKNYDDSVREMNKKSGGN